MSSETAESMNCLFGGVSTSAGLALIRDEADPMMKGKKCRVDRDVLTGGEFLDSDSP